MTYSAVQGGFPGWGNIDDDPYFALVAFWDRNGTPDDVSDDFCIPGDYRLHSRTDLWEPGEEAWIRDNVINPCIDAGNPDSETLKLYTDRVPDDFLFTVKVPDSITLIHNYAK